MNIHYIIELSIIIIAGICFILIYKKLISIQNNELLSNTTDTKQYQYLQSLVTNAVNKINDNNIINIPIGSIICSASTSNIDNNFLVCDGSKYLITDYTNLFSAIGTIYNLPDTDSNLYFNVPDLRGIYIRGLDPNHTIGQYEKYSTALPISNPFITSNDGLHIHTTNSNGDHFHDTIWANFNMSSLNYSFNGPNISRHYMSANNADGTNLTNATGTSTTGAHTHDISSSGNHTHTIISGGDLETQPNHISLIYLIKAN